MNPSVSRKEHRELMILHADLMLPQPWNPIWGERFEREGLEETGGHGRVRERELACVRERVCVLL